MSKSVARSGALCVALVATACTSERDRAALAERDLPPAARVDAAGELLLATLDCTACHRAPSSTDARLRTLAAPDLSGAGARLSPSWTRAFLLDPRALQPDSRMPDALAGLDADERGQAADELVHFLASLGGPYDPAPLAPDAWDVARGQELFETLGCLPCHADRLQPRALARKTDLASLVAFLRHPLAQRPSGEMSPQWLDEGEARALAAYLLRAQHEAGPQQDVRTPGLSVSAYELPDFPSSMPDFTALHPVRVATAATIDASWAPRDDEFALRFVGELLVAEAGEHEVFVESDDGSRLLLDGRLVVDNDGLHSQARKSAKVALDAGWHALEVTMFEAGGDAYAGAGWIVDGEAQPFTADELSTRRQRWTPLGSQPFELDARKADRGRDRYEALGCAACHPLPGLADAPDAPPLLALDATRGCLADAPARDVPRYALTLDERASLARALAAPDVLGAPHTPSDAVAHGLALYRCTACHPRDGAGGPQGAVRAAFVGSADLGDEGRLPPDLTGVGAKLRPAWLERVVVEGAMARPYVVARMPVFGRQNVAHLVPALLAADRDPDARVRPAPEPGDDVVAAGRRLVGRTGLSCISCHEILGHESVGIPGLDLARMPERLELDWFRRFLAEPLAMRPGTRMPTFWEDGESVVRDVLDADPAAQTDALWTYLSLGASMPLPTGLIVDRASYDLVPVEKAVWCAVFMDGLSARVLAVGFPERVSVAFDEQHVRLARLWRGDFLNVQGTWRARAGKLERPLGDEVIDLPPGAPFARLADAARDAWPSATGREAGWRLAEKRRDALGRPTFVTRSAGVQIEETLRAGLSVETGRLVRAFVVRAPGDGRDGLVLRAAVGSTIEPVASEPSDGEGALAFRTDDGRDVVVRGARAWVRDAPDVPGTRELLVDAAPPAGRPTSGFEVEMRW